MNSAVHRCMPFLIVAAGVAAYANSVNGVFLFDDRDSILENRSIRRLWPIGAPLSPPSNITTSGRPIANLTLAIDFALHGVRPAGYHVTNLIIHLLAALTLYGIVRRSLLRPPLPDRFRANAAALAGAIAILWTVHPLQTESVTYVVQRVESLAGLFILLTLYAAIRHRASAPPFWFAIAVLACALGMATKEVAVAAPLLVPAYDLVFRSRASAAQTGRKRLYASLAATWIILVALMALGPRTRSVGFSLPTASALQYAWTQFRIIVHYLKLCVWPAPLVLDYGWLPGDTPFVENLASACLIAALLVATIALLLRKSPLAFIGAWFFLILAPTSSFVPIADLAFEHRMYLPLASVLTVLILVGFWLTPRRIATPAPLLALSLSAAVVLGSMTRARNADYADDIKLWTTVVQQRPLHPRAHNNLGNALAHAHRHAEAIDQFIAAIQLSPHYPDAHWNAAASLVELGRVDDALTCARTAVQLAPDSPIAHNNLAMILANRSDLAQATSELLRAIELQPDYAQAHWNYAAILRAFRKLDDALAEARLAVALSPGAADAHFHLAGVLSDLHESTEARTEFERAAELAPDDLLVPLGYGRFLEMEDQWDAAQRQYDRALQIAPNDCRPHLRMAALLADRGREALAKAHFVIAASLEPDSVTAGLASNLAKAGKLNQAIAQMLALLQAHPQDAELHFNLAHYLADAGRTAESIASYREAVRIRPDWTVALNNLAWALATLPASSPRDDEEAIVLAARALQAAGKPDPVILDTLAAAQAAAGQFTTAIKTAERALTEARTTAAAGLAAEIESHLALYRKTKSLRALPAASTTATAPAAPSTASPWPTSSMPAGLAR